MCVKKYQDENGKFEFDFAGNDVWEYHEIASKTPNFCDVDFVIKTKDKVIFLEYKNALGIAKI